MGSIVVVMPKIEDARRLAGAIRSKGYNVDMVCAKGSEALHCIKSRNCGVLICGYRLQDMSHIELIDYMPQYFEMILVTSESKLDSCSDKAIKVTLPLHIPILVKEVSDALDRVERQLRHDKKGPGSRSEEDRRIIENAQMILMNERGMARIESYRYIQKRSMDSSVSMVEMAGRILNGG